MESLKRMLNYLTVETRLDLKAVVLQYVQSLTGSDDGTNLLLKEPKVLKSLISLTQDESESIAKDVCLALVNISADEAGARALLSAEVIGDVAQESDTNTETKAEASNVVSVMIKFIMDPESSLADPACMVLSNLTRPSSNIERVIELVEKCGFTMDEVVSVFTKQGYNKKGANLHYLGPVFSNLSQSVTFRRYLMDRDRCVIQRLVPFTEYKDSSIRRGGIIGTLRNCCFDVEFHSWLLGPDVDILPRLLLPLAGPEEFTDDEMEKLPPELQYLPDDKEREHDPDLRTMLLEALLQLCTERSSRELMRDKNVYVILREFHKWEKDRSVLLACENVVDILIRTEEEIGKDNIQDVEVPEDLQDKFKKMDEDFVKD